MRTSAVLVVAMLLTLCGCSQSGGDGAAAAATSHAPTGGTLTLPPSSPGPTTATGATTASSPAAASDTATAVINDRGNVVETLGRQAGIRAPDGEQAVVFSVDRVTVDQPCTATGHRPPVHGHYLGVQVRVTTGNLDFLGGTFTVSANDFAVRGPDGAMHFDLAGPGALNCVPEGQSLPTAPLGPGREYAGTIVLDSPVTAGNLVFRTPALPGNGWEWPF